MGGILIQGILCMHLSRFMWYQPHNFQNNFPIPLQWTTPHFPPHVCRLSNLVCDVILLRVSVWSYHTQTCVSSLLASRFLYNIKVHWLKLLQYINFTRSSDGLTPYRNTKRKRIITKVRPHFCVGLAVTHPMYCSLPRLIVLTPHSVSPFHLQARSTSDDARDLYQRKVELWARNVRSI
jgi:hypothetical protein